MNHKPRSGQVPLHVPPLCAGVHHAHGEGQRRDRRLPPFVRAALPGAQGDARFLDGDGDRPLSVAEDRKGKGTYNILDIRTNIHTSGVCFLFVCFGCLMKGCAWSGGEVCFECGD